MILTLMALQVASTACTQHLELASRAFASRDFQKAAAEFSQAAPICPQRLHVLISLGQTQFLAGDAPAAETTLRQAISIDEKSSAARYALGRLLYQQNRYPDAVAQFERIVELEPDHYRAHDNLGLCFDALQQDTKALRHFFRALDLVKDAHREYDWPYANLAEFFLKRDQFEKAFQLAAEAAERNPQSGRNFLLAGQALLRLDRIENSLRWLQKSTELDPGNADAHFQLGQALRRLGRSAEAKVHMDEFRKLKARVSSGPDPASRP